MNIITRATLFCFILLMPLSALAGEKEDIAKEIMTLTNVNQMMDQVKAQVLEMQDQIINRMDIPEDQKERSMEFQKKIHDKIFEIMGFDNMEKDYLDLFTSVYTLEELKGILEFYKSPVGKSLLEKQPLIIQKVITMSQEKVKILIPELQKMSREFEASLKKE